MPPASLPPQPTPPPAYQATYPSAPGPAPSGGSQPSPLAAGADYTNQFNAQEIEEGKLLSIIGYLGILFLVPMLALPNNRFARFHANQGLVLFIGYIAVGIIVTILDQFPIIWLFAWILYFVPLVLMVLGMITAGSGRAKTLPLIGNFQLVK